MKGKQDMNYKKLIADLKSAVKAGIISDRQARTVIHILAKIPLRNA
jgi:hypothetical protein